jgi:hypothetical protein
MRPVLTFNGRLAEIVLLAGILAGCSSADLPDRTQASTGGSAGSGGSGEVGGGVGNAGGINADGVGGSEETGGNPDEGDMDADLPEGGSDETPEGGVADDAGVSGCLDTSSMPTYDGQLTMCTGGPVGPVVTMACPGDPTEGFVEYTDTFHVERPYNVPINTRFSIDGGIYNFWVHSNDKPHSTTTRAKNPRTEARWSQNFTSGIRMWSADMMLEDNTNHSVVMQVHTTTTGIGPVYLHVEGDAIAGSTIKASDIPGGLFNNWFNLKVMINAATTESHIYVNNCLITTQKGTRGNGVDYFKCGVYHCGSAECRDHFKNIHLYQKL